MKAAGLSDINRPILTHCQVLGPDIIEDMALLGVVGSIQPSFVITDTGFAKKSLHESVLPYSYCW